MAESKTLIEVPQVCLRCGHFLNYQISANSDFFFANQLNDVISGDTKMPDLLNSFSLLIVCNNCHSPEISDYQYNMLHKHFSNVYLVQGGLIEDIDTLTPTLFN